MKAAHSQSTKTLLLWTLSLLIAFSPLMRSSEACGVSVYWGQNLAQDGSLRELCETGYYSYVNLAYLATFGCGQKLALNLTDHCDPASGGCRSLSTEIQACQNRGVKVLLSLGGNNTEYQEICTAEDAKKVADNAYNTFLKGSNPDGPLGDVSLDGVDLDIEYPGSMGHWDDLVRALASYRSPQRKVYLSASASCSYPDTNLGKAITTGLLDYVAVRFYDDNLQCSCYAGTARILETWNKWSSSLPEGNQLFYGWWPSSNAGSQCKPEVFTNEILPVISSSPDYGGVMLREAYENVSILYPAAACCNTAGLHRKESLISVL
ncbi:Acidic endochitinase [Sesamum alatum]|uniref:chitinase n=1 Tax=Sesamum alatum TaxID=300844 RepID=A0AAE1YRB9_9LAMI|nr:Acidic endochitinase [Sesamum alatum]